MLMFYLLIVSTFFVLFLLAPNLAKVTAVVGLWGWIAVSLSFGSLVMFFQCSSKDPGFIKTSGEIGNHADAETSNVSTFVFTNEPGFHQEVLPSGDLLVLDSANSNLYKISSSLSLFR
ncbi:hypothetical protein LguiB_001553 [Lonicera macranthoides]